MTYQEAVAMARGQVGPYCKACPVCNGIACKNSMPGPGAKGSGMGFVRNVEKWQSICLNMDTIGESKPVDTSASFFGRDLALPVFVAPIGSLKFHYSDRLDDATYNNILINACKKAGVGVFTGDSTNPVLMAGNIQAVADGDGWGIPTIKPWDMDNIRSRFEAYHEANPMGFAMDIDGAGLPFLKNHNPPAGRKTVEELREIAQCAQRPFILKGIMTVAGAKKAVDAGVSGIVVSNHGGRVLDCCPSTAEVLPAIADAVGKDVTIFVDGGIRSGMDVFKALALGADGVLIGRPFVPLVFGAGEQGVRVYVDKLKAELEDTMTMCGAYTIGDINRDMLYLG